MKEMDFKKKTIMDLKEMDINEMDFKEIDFKKKTIMDIKEIDFNEMDFKKMDFNKMILRKQILIK